MLLSWLKILKKPNAPTSGSGIAQIRAQVDDQEIPRYPPFAKGLPAVTPDKVLKTQEQLLADIRHTLGLDHDLFDRLIFPVLQNFAAFVHLLPASEAHHHRGAGGLFRHGLEVAYWAARASEGVVFVATGTPLERKQLEPRWHVAVCLAGLLHDIGKPVSDVMVVDASGEKTWNPCNESLMEWAGRHGIDRFFLRWRDRRFRRHEQFSVLVAERVLTPDIRAWLIEPGPEILQAVLEGMSGANPEHVLSRLVNDADRTSVERDLRANSMPQDMSMGVPVERYLLDAMRRMVSDGIWSVNDKGARVWVLRDGVFVVWKHAAMDITDVLSRDRIPGIPRAHDTLADILIERSLAIPHQRPDGTTYRYWPVAPRVLESEGKHVTLHMLKLASPDLIFSSEPPAPVDALIADQIEKHAEQGERAKRAARAGIKLSGQDRQMELAEGHVSQEQQSPDVGDVKGEPPEEMQVAIPPPEARKRAPESKPTLPETSTNEDTEPSVEQAGDKPSKTPSREQPSTEPPKEIHDLLRHGGQAGEILTAMALDIRHGRKKWGQSIARVAGEVVVVYPEGAKTYGDPGQILKLLAEQGWVTTDPLAPMKKVRDIAGIKGLVLDRTVATSLMRLSETSPSQEVDYRETPRDQEQGVASNPKAKQADKPAAREKTLRTPQKKEQPTTASTKPTEQPSGNEADFWVENLLRMIRQRSPEISGSIEESEDGWLFVADDVIKAWRAERKISIAKFEVAIRRHPDVRKEPSGIAIRGDKT